MKQHCGIQRFGLCDGPRYSLFRFWSCFLTRWWTNILEFKATIHHFTIILQSRVPLRPRKKPSGFVSCSYVASNRMSAFLHLFSLTTVVPNSLQRTLSPQQHEAY